MHARESYALAQKTGIRAADRAQKFKLSRFKMAEQRCVVDPPRGVRVHEPDSAFPDKRLHSLNRRRAAIHHVGLTRNEGRFVRCQEKRQPADLPWLSYARDWLRSFQLLAIFVILPQVLAEVGLDEPCAYRVHPDRLLTELL